MNRTTNWRTCAARRTGLALLAVVALAGAGGCSSITDEVLAERVNLVEAGKVQPQGDSSAVVEVSTPSVRKVGNVIIMEGTVTRKPGVSGIIPGYLRVSMVSAKGELLGHEDVRWVPNFIPEDGKRQAEYSVRRFQLPAGCASVRAEYKPGTPPPTPSDVTVAAPRTAAPAVTLRSDPFAPTAPAAASAGLPFVEVAKFQGGAGSNKTDSFIVTADRCKVSWTSNAPIEDGALLVMYIRDENGGYVARVPVNRGQTAGTLTTKLKPGTYHLTVTAMRVNWEATIEE